MEIICRYLIDHLCSSARQREAFTGVGLISDSDFMLLERGSCERLTDKEREREGGGGEKERKEEESLLNYGEFARLISANLPDDNESKQNKTQSVFYKILTKVKLTGSCCRWSWRHTRTHTHTHTSHIFIIHQPRLNIFPDEWRNICSASWINSRGNDWLEKLIYREDAARGREVMGAVKGGKPGI